MPRGCAEGELLLVVADRCPGRLSQAVPGWVNGCATAPRDLLIQVVGHGLLAWMTAWVTLRFADEDAYPDFWREHPALRETFTSLAGDALSAYLLHDLVHN